MRKPPRDPLVRQERLDAVAPDRGERAGVFLRDRGERAIRVARSGHERCRTVTEVRAEPVGAGDDVVGALAHRLEQVGAGVLPG